MKWNSGNSRTPQPKFIADYFREYNLYMEEHNINAYVVEIEVPQLICVTGLGNLRVLPKYDGPKWRADDNAVDIVREKDDVTPFDVDLLCSLAELIRQNAMKQKIKILVNKNLKDMLNSEGLI